ncbi:MAG: HEAT repeat domain-containing protein [Rivularia sp. (in: Bacteria)]|nr:HEAT repeat domain-containing protein [Rivularia sp. MS3]
MLSADYPQFETYLQSISEKYKCWWNLYTLTDAEGKKTQQQSFSSPFDFGLMVQIMQPKQEQENLEQEKIERLPVLEGIRKYANNHVLLRGKPGSGKSTALARLLLEEARAYLEINFQAHSQSRFKTTESSAFSQFQLTSAISQGIDSLASSVNDIRIPVLIELRYWQTSIFERIQAFLQHHDANLNLDETTLKNLLRQGKFLLLIDGVNELPSEESRRQVGLFRNNFSQTPMIFTTRDLSVGGDLGIEKKLEMQPLNETQMRDFVISYLPQKGEEMLQRLGNRLQKFGKTPLLLWMLCDLFQQTGNIPSNLGMVFRLFTESYENNLRGDVVVTAESRRWWKSLLEYLAFVMMQGEPVTEFRVAIPKREVEEIFTKYLTEEKFDKPRDYAKCWLEDLIKHHLIQVETGDKIEFRHQLLQEYYAAEYLLRRLPDISNAKLQRDYLNLLKWTEPVALMLALVEEEAQALRVVKLGLDVDLMLGARFAGEVRQEFQEKTVKLVLGLNTTYGIKINLLGATGSKFAIFPLLQILNSGEHDDYYYNIAENLAYLGYDKIMSSIIESQDVHSEMMNEAAQYKDWDNYCLLTDICSELENITSSNTAIYKLLKLLKHKKFNRNTWTSANFYIKGLNYEPNQKFLGERTFEKIISLLLQFLNHEDFRIRYDAAYVLGNIGSETEVVYLIKLIKDENYFVCSSAIDALGKIGSTKAACALIDAINDDKSFVRYRVVKALGLIGSSVAIPALIERLDDEKYFVRIEVVEALKKISDDKTINALRNALEDNEPDVRRVAARALGYKGNYLAVNELIFALKDEVSYVSYVAKTSLIDICKCLIEDGLKKIFSDSDILQLNINIESMCFGIVDIPKNAAYEFSSICEKYLEYILSTSDYLNKYKYLSIHLSSDNSIETELKYYIWEVILSDIRLIAKLDTIDTVSGIQNFFKFYNHDIFHSPPLEDENNKNSQTSQITYDMRGANIGNVAHNVEGNQQSNSLQ